MGDNLPLRRTVLAAGAAAAGVALTGCGEEKSTDTGADKVTDRASGKAPGSAPTAGDDAVLATAADVPVGGGTVITAEKVVVTQPAAGKFKAFSAVCTHQGCLVNKVANGTIDCPCHGSKFSAEDGSVTTGPATKPLEEKEITVTDGKISLS
ncbi:Rieske (2Fe-2S) protein [Streptomyces bambusae]|uniref:QcrA and Rieske domain-containing protein n=1 Tax=Streptomyces bambusae TaxID=1550616 RepID=UPI001CFF11EF|nr:Rieske (2Fe-2S) protein [Streptomyces bambusae]MCB5167077.1 Rieske (2Fe-2S) protein [Streptomyces bambusae]